MRLTFKAKNPFTGKEQYYPDSVYDDENTGEKMVDFNKQTECNNKLGRLEDLEDELGIDLITLFKALENGIYWKCGDDIEYDEVEFEYNSYSDENTPKSYFLSGNTIHLFRDYGKTWALTKGELL